jgi:hypothetical protein
LPRIPMVAKYYNTLFYLCFIYEHTQLGATPGSLCYDIFYAKYA